MRLNIEEFIEWYYNRQRLRSALGYSPPEEFEQQTGLPESVARSASATRVLQTMPNTRDGFSGGWGDVAPSASSPASAGDGKQSLKAASVPTENCLAWVTSNGNI
jgi:hypothetical protein